MGGLGARQIDRLSSETTGSYVIVVDGLRQTRRNTRCGFGNAPHSRTLVQIGVRIVCDKRFKTPASKHGQTNTFAA